MTRLQCERCEDGRYPSGFSFRARLCERCEDDWVEIDPIPPRYGPGDRTLALSDGGVCDACGRVSCYAGRPGSARCYQSGGPWEPA